MCKLKYGRRRSRRRMPMECVWVAPDREIWIFGRHSINKRESNSNSINLTQTNTIVRLCHYAEHGIHFSIQYETISKINREANTHNTNNSRNNKNWTNLWPSANECFIPLSPALTSTPRTSALARTIECGMGKFVNVNEPHDAIVIHKIVVSRTRIGLKMKIKKKKRKAGTYKTFDKYETK